MERSQRGSRARPRLRSVSVQDELKQRIDRGELAAGARLPSEPELAAELQVSRATLREALRAAGMTAGIAHARHWVEPVPAGEAALLELEPGQDVLVIERVRTAGGKPVVLSRDLVPSRLVGGNDRAVQGMLERSIYDVLERDLGIVISHGVARFRPVRAGHAVAARLGVPRGELLLYLWQVDYAEEGSPVISSHEFHLADAFDFTVVRRGPGRRFT